MNNWKNIPTWFSQSCWKLMWEKSDKSILASFQTSRSWPRLWKLFLKQHPPFKGLKFLLHNWDQAATTKRPDNEIFRVCAAVQCLAVCMEVFVFIMWVCLLPFACVFILLMPLTQVRCHFLSSGRPNPLISHTSTHTQKINSRSASHTHGHSVIIRLSFSYTHTLKIALILLWGSSLTYYIPLPHKQILNSQTPFEGLSQSLDHPKHPDFMNLALTKIDVPTHLTFWVWSCREGKGCAVSQIACRLFASSVSPPCLLFYLLLLLLPYFAELLSEAHPPHEPWQSEHCPHGLETVQKHRFLTGNMWLSNVWNMAQHATVKSQLRRSFSEHVKDSTNKAWDVFWRGVRERRLWGELGFDVSED